MKFIPASITVTKEEKTFLEELYDLTRNTGLATLGELVCAIVDGDSGVSDLAIYYEGGDE